MKFSMSVEGVQLRRTENGETTEVTLPPIRFSYETPKKPHKYNDGRALLKSLGVPPPANWLSKNVYALLTKQGYSWDTKAKKWLKTEIR